MSKKNKLKTWNTIKKSLKKRSGVKILKIEKKRTPVKSKKVIFPKKK